MEEGAKESFCLLLWVANGGRLNAKGRPQFKKAESIRGYCSSPSDCSGCVLMQKEIAQYPIGRAFWVCPDCLTTLIKDAKARNLSFRLPGHYTEGQCQHAGCSRPAYTLGEIERPSRYSIFLQVIIYVLEEQHAGT